jgi:hypothetical protein
MIPAAICVNVVVDDGRAALTRHCTTASYGDIAAQVLAERAREVHRPAPRYNGNFLCAIDGYPGSGCGDHGTEPYWSFWIWAHGKWTYSSYGVDSYPVGDSDHDGKPDPIGFRYQPFETKQTPRSGGFPAAATQPPRPAPTATTRAPAPPTAMRRPTTDPTTPAPTTRHAAPASRTASPTATADATPDAVEPTAIASSKRSGGVPVGTVAAGVLAAALIGAAAWRFRGGASP